MAAINATHRRQAAMSNEEVLYIHQLRCCLQDVMAVGKPKIFFKKEWERRVLEANRLLASRPEYSSGVNTKEAECER